MKPIERRIGRLEAARPGLATSLTIHRVIVDRMPDGTLKQTVWIERNAHDVTAPPFDDGRVN